MARPCETPMDRRRCAGACGDAGRRGGADPDDEVLMVGGLLAQLARKGIPVRVIAVTDGAASHRGSSTWTAKRLRYIRHRESRAALRCLGIVEPPLRLKLADGEVARQHMRLAERLCGLIDHRDFVFTTWRCDGHPDHEATAQACASAALRQSARIVEVPLWAGLELGRTGGTSDCHGEERAAFRSTTTRSGASALRFRPMRVSCSRIARWARIRSWIPKCCGAWSGRSS